MTSGSGTLAHIGIPGPAPFIAMGFFFAGFGAAYGAYWFFNHPPPSMHRAPVVGLGVIAVGCFVLATIFPILLGSSVAWKTVDGGPAGDPLAARK